MIARCSAALVIGASAFLLSSTASADEGGVSFWLPGQFGSMAATPGTPGLTFATVYYHLGVTGGGDVAFARQVARGNLTAKFSGTLDVDLKARGDLIVLSPTYVFEKPILGAQFALGLTGLVGRSEASVDTTLTGSVGPLGFSRSAGRTDAVTGAGDLYPMATLKWNQGVHNYMTYATGNIPVGDYDKNRLANLGIGHGSMDGGVGYTYFNPKTGHEFSVVTGLTYNFENNHTNYKNGVDWHLDMGASQFLSKTLHVGVVGYAYHQLTGDSGTGAKLGDFKSQVFGAGPQVGFIIPMGDVQGYLNIKGYKEFGAEHRADGWNTWLTFAVSPAPKAPPPE